MSDIPSVRWGIVSTGLISSWFVEDLVLERKDAKVKHIIQSIGSSSLQKGKDFAAKFCPNVSPKIYDSYEQIYNDPDVDIVYIGTPHAFHKKNCLDAITAGKNVFCEKAFTLNTKEAKEVFEAAKAKNVYVGEAMWLRHRPLVHDIRKLIHEDKIIGEPFRMFVDFALDIDISSLPDTSRYKDLALGAGSLLDIGIYSLTWAILALDATTPGNSEKPKILATQTFEQGIEVNTSTLLNYASTGRQAIVTSTTNKKSRPGVFATIHGSNGFIEVEGAAPSLPLSFTVYPKAWSYQEEGKTEVDTQKHDYPRIGKGFIYEADNTALDVLAGRKESAIMPWSETIRVMEIMDEIRRQGGTKYAVDDE